MLHSIRARMIGRSNGNFDRTIGRTLSQAIGRTIGISAAVMVFTSLVNLQAASANVAEKFSKFSAGSTTAVDHSAWDRLLKAYVKPDGTGLNRIDYAAFKNNDHKALKAYVKALEATQVSKLNKNEQFAFWANLYNAKTIDVVLDHYPVPSIRKITIKSSLLGFLKKSVGAGGPWKTKIMNVGGEKLSLDDIEHGIMRPIFKDPRVHYAVNCASIGCPNLRTAAFTGANLETELNAGARDYINNARGVSVTGGKVTASSIYKWFQTDFGGSQAGVLKHVSQYAEPKLKAKLSQVTAINGFDYDWALNDIKK